MDEQIMSSEVEPMPDELSVTEEASAPEAEAAEPISRTQALLETLSEETAQPIHDADTEARSAEASLPVRGPDGRFMSAPSTPEEAALGDTAPTVDMPVSDTPDAEMAELLEGMTSERSRTRLQEIFTQRQQYARELNDIRDMFQATGMQAQDFAQTLEFGRLANANDPQSLQLALQMVETQRQALCQKLGIERPGVDVLVDYPDLAQDVQNNLMPRERALEMAKLRREQQGMQQSLQADATQRQAQQQFEQSITQGQQAITGYLSQRAQEADHPVRMQAIHDYFAKPANVQAFVTNYQPHQWNHAIQWMYEQIRLAPQAAPTPQPLRTPATKLTTAGVNPQAEPIDRLAQRLESMGL